MAKKLIPLDYHDEYDFILSGIFCGYRDYRLCFELNRVLQLDLNRQDDLEMNMERKGSSSEFTVFSAVNEDDESYFLVVNKGSNGFFTPEHPKIDFFLLVKNASRYTTPEVIHKQVLSIPIVTSIISLEPSSLRSADNFLLLEIKNT